MDVRRGVMHNDRGQTTPNEALRTILPIAGWCDTQAADVIFTGGADPVLPTPFHIGAAGAATLAASGLAAAELWQVRTGRVTVDLRQATAALRSGHYLQLAGTDVSSDRNTIMGFYPDPRRARVLSPLQFSQSSRGGTQCARRSGGS